MEPIRLLFDVSNRLNVTLDSEGRYNYAPGDNTQHDWHNFGQVEQDAHSVAVLCARLSTPGNDPKEWQTLYQLRSRTRAPELDQALNLIDKQLYRIPYLGMGENEYIYRFRTTKERNRSIYIDDQSETLYQSALCQAIKEARRTKEKSSGEPAVLDFGAVSYVIPSHFGFCLGVQNAIERAYETVAMYPERRVFMLSELIHNPFVNEDLLARGLRYLQTDKGLPLRADGQLAISKDDPAALWNQLSEEDIVIIPAFGATNEDKSRLIRRGLSIRENDATCMLVEKVWKAARRYAQEGFTVLIHGKSEHEETKATFSNSSSHGPALMIRNMEHARRLAEVIQAEPKEKKRLFESSFAGLYSEGFDPQCDLEKISVVNQTTLLRNETLNIIDYLRDVIAAKYGENAVANHLWSKGKGDTLCYATQVNQDALQKAVEQAVDAALVVGGKNSSNTFQLYRVCEERFGPRAHYIQSEKNIHSLESVRHYIFPYNLTSTASSIEEDRPLFQTPVHKPRILLTGGASCPDGIIQQVIHRINCFFPPEEIRPLNEILETFENEEERG
ncbi:MAG: 4-hydroxy-3-methylbut-2-enyl diphosphate reductase [Puniceicoccaceae bacterium]|nr:MAG: 4-hydroxy-3-methylbut-2-enyl diphosphate reductase [Puniceicoccaceae bacterium]